MSACTKLGCDQPSYAKEMCKKHYLADWYRADPDRRTRRHERIRRRRQEARQEPSMFLKECYTRMFCRVRGTGSPHKSHLYKGLPIMPRDEFIKQSLNDPEFLKLYRRWQSLGFVLRYVPTPDRIDSDDGYVWRNIEWVTHSENSRRSSETRRRAA